MQKTKKLNSVLTNFRLIISVLLVMGLHAACNNQKYLTEEETLYTGKTVNYIKNGAFKVGLELKEDIDDVIYPEPNKVLFGVLRPKLWFYNTTKEPQKEKGFRYWKKYKLGAPPVLLRETNPDRISKLIINRLYNHGHFEAKVDYEIDGKNKKASIVYHVDLKAPYLIDSLFFPEVKGELTRLIDKTKSNSLVKSGEAYNLELLKEERARIADEMHEAGIYYFEPDFLLFKIDSTIGNRKVNVYLNVKKTIKEEYLEVKELGNIYLFPNYDLRNFGGSIQSDTLLSNGVQYLLQDSSIRPEIVTDAVYLKSGSNYSKSAHDFTVNRLIGLGVYQFVSIKYVPDSLTNKLDAYIQLTPSTKKSIRLEVSGTTKSNGYTGPGFQASFRDKNLFKGAELLTLSLITGYEVQLSSNSSGLNSYEIGANISLDIPRFIVPFNLKTINSKYTPFTTFKTGIRTLNRLDYYQLNSFDLSVGYRWRASETKKHEFFPASINYVNLAKSSPEFEEILDENPLVRRSFEEQFILGSIYSFIYDNHSIRKHRNNYYFKGTVDLSGNIAQLLNTINNNESFGEESNYELLGINFSQYFRLETTNKYNIKLGGKNVLANRLIMAAGIPYGNSTTLPYIKQFFIGGGNSIRAFQARSIGPGTYRRTDEDLNGNIFIDQSGDIKLEFNTEYRFNIFSIYKGAVFLDAGNVWLMNEDTLRPGGNFEVDKFMNQLAVGTGFGLRIDPDFFVIRLDLGFPLRKPYLAEGEQWVFDRFWKDAVLNIAIGYPF